MMLAQHARSIASRLTGTNQAAPSPIAPPFRPSALAWAPRLSPDDDGTGMWLPAGLVDERDEVSVDGSWHTVTRSEVTEPDEDQPGSALLHFNGTQRPYAYEKPVYMRSAEHHRGEIGGAL